MAKIKTKARLTKKEKQGYTDNEKLVLFWRAHPVQAAKDIFNVELVWYQRICILMMWRLRFFLLLMGRGIGKTWLSALVVSLYAMLYPKTKIGIIAPVLRQASFLFDYIANFYHDCPMFRTSVRKLSRSMNREYIEFKNGSFIEGLPLGDGSKVRGRRYNFIVVDEYAQVPEEILKLVVNPMMNIKRRGIENKLVIGGTAYYPWNHYYKQYLLFNVMSELRPDLYGFVEFDYEDLMIVKDPPYQIDEKNLEMLKANSTVDEFLMENKCLFPIESSGFFSAKLIDGCTPTSNEGSPVELIGNSIFKYVLGIDAARVEGGDNFVIQILRLKGRQKRLVRTITLNGVAYPDMVETIRNVCLNYNVVRIHMDSQGGGMAIYDLLVLPWTHPIDGKTMLPIFDMDDKKYIDAEGLHYLRLISPTRPINNDLFHGLKAEMEHERLLFPITRRRDADRVVEKALNDLNQTKQELLMLVAEGKGMYFTFDAPAGRKKDRAVALALANNAAKDYLSIPEVTTRQLAVGGWA